MSFKSRCAWAPVTAHDYVQDGLVGLWDGRENAGWGTHDGSSCRNLISDRWHGSVGSGVVVGECFFEFNGVRNVANTITLGTEWFGRPDYFTAEVCYEITGAGAQSIQSPFGGQEGGGNFCFSQWNPTSGTRAFAAAISTTPSPASSFGNSARIYEVEGGISTQSEGISAESVFVSSFAFTGSRYRQMMTDNDISCVAKWNQAYPCYIGSDAYNPTEYHLKGRVYCCRFYSRALSESERRANAVVDKVRFGGAS